MSSKEIGMNYTELVDIKPLKKCTLQQACEFTAFNWEPVDDFTDKTLKRPSDRTSANERNDTIWQNKMKTAEDKITYFLRANKLIASGKVKTKRIEKIDLSTDCVINIKNNAITDNEHTYTDIELDFYELQSVLKHPLQRMQFTLSLENDCIFLTIDDNAVKMLVKRLQATAKNTSIIRKIMNTPNKLIARDEFATIEKYDRIDQILDSCLPSDIYHLFFDCTSNSALFNPNASDIDLRKRGIKTLTVV